jgi:hypothetical protein
MPRIFRARVDARKSANIFRDPFLPFSRLMSRIVSVSCSRLMVVPLIDARQGKLEADIAKMTFER